jgi:cell division initiation protein
MPLTPLDIQKHSFPQKLRGLDPVEVEHFLAIVAEELARRIADAERLERENRQLRERLASTEQRERQLQDAILRGKQVSDEIIQTSQKEAQLLVKEAEIHADRLVSQAMERAQEIENRIQELRTRRKELQLKLRGTLELFAQILEAEMEDERTTANVHTLARRRKRMSGLLPRVARHFAEEAVELADRARPRVPGRRAARGRRPRRPRLAGRARSRAPSSPPGSSAGADAALDAPQPCALGRASSLRSPARRARSRPLSGRSPDAVPRPP